MDHITCSLLFKEIIKIHANYGIHFLFILPYIIFHHHFNSTTRYCIGKEIGGPKYCK